MYTEITLSGNNCITVWTMELCHVFCVLLENMHLHGTTLCESGMTNVALIRLLTRMCPHVSFKLVCISARITAQTTLKRSFSCMGTDVSFQLTNLHTRIVTHRALEWLLMCMFVATVTHQFSTGHKSHVTISAFMGTSSCVCVEVVSEQSNRSKGSSTQVAFVRSFICVALHVTVQVGATWTGVATQLALKGLLNSFLLDFCGLWWFHVSNNFLSIYFRQ